MAFGSMLDKAKEKANSAKVKVGSASNSTMDKAKERATEVKDKTNNAKQKVNDVAIAKLEELSENFNIAIPYIKEAGFTIKEVEIEMSIPPKIKASFEITRELSDEEQAEELEKVAEDKLLRNLLNALFKAYKIQKTVKMGSLKFKVVTIEVGFIPSVTMKFQ